MKKIIIFIFVNLILLSSTPSIAEDEFVKFAKTLSAKDYDNSLPLIPIEKWLSSILPDSIIAVWGKHITGCGEQTGDLSIDKERDLPLCAEVELKENKKAIGYLLLFIGTEKQDKLQKNAGLYYGYIKYKNKTINFKKLSELADIKAISNHST